MDVKTSEVPGTEEQAADIDESFDLGGLTDDEVQEILESVEVAGPEEEMPLKAAMLDLLVAHQEIEQYKAGALTLCEALAERQEEAELNGRDDVAAVIDEVKTSAFGVFLRIHRGDAEITGDRDGEYSDFFEAREIPDEFEFIDGSPD